MSANTKIEWCDATFNSWIGCTKVSPGCANCYAERDFGHRKHVATWGPGQPRHRTGVAKWKEPLAWNNAAGAGHFCEVTLSGGLVARGDIRALVKAGMVVTRDRVVQVRPRVFCGSLCDLFDSEVPIEWLVDLLDLIRRTTHLDWLLLTKRPELWRKRLMYAFANTGSDELKAWLNGWLCGTRVPANVWIGTSVENQKAWDDRANHLFKIPAHTRFLSCEPLLGPVDIQPGVELCHASRDGECYAKTCPQIRDKEPSKSGRHCPLDRWGDADEGEKPPMIDWVICGGESGKDARPMHPDWARSLRDQCAAAGVAFLFKQWGEWAPSDGEKDRGEFHFFRDGQCMERIGKKSAGRLLDGREHNEFPEVRHA